MKTVTIKETYDLSIGTVIIADAKGIRVGDEILCDNNVTYTVKDILMPTKPTDDDLITLIV